MTPQQDRRVPLAFIDRTGYVTPFNGILDTTLDGWYIYNPDELQAALLQQRALEEKRVKQEIGIIDVQYYEKAEDDNKKPTEETPDFIKNILGKDKTVPFLQIGSSKTGGEVVDGVDAPVPIVVKTTTADDLHTEPDNENLTEDEIIQRSLEGLNVNQVAKTLMDL